MSRTGEEYIESLRDGRTIFLNGEKITNHVDHPAFRNAIRTVASLYDYQAEHADRMTFQIPGGKHVGLSWELPDTQEKLIARGEAAYAWAMQSCGWLGRSPDHVASALAGMITHLEVFEEYSKDRAEALKNYYLYARDKDIYLTFTLVNPQGDRSKTPSEHVKNVFHTLRVLEEKPQGIIVRGAKMLGTAAVLAEEVFVGVFNPLKEFVDDQYALSFALPLNTKGIKTLSRKSYEMGSNKFDSPLSHQFDENDAVVYFDDVFVPWERVFVYKNTGMCRRQFQATAADVLMDVQGMARYAVKLHFLSGLAHQLTEAIGINEFPAVRQSLAELACHATNMEGLFRGLLHNPVRCNEYYIPSRLQLYACQVVLQSIYPKVMENIRKLSGGGVIMLPSNYVDFANPEIRGLIEKTQYSTLLEPIERVKLLKLVWDAIGSEFASRHTQYEMFYSGAHFMALSRVYEQYDWDFAKSMSRGILDSIDMN
ncbi:MULTISPECIES: 4-hydroxyphenylacetate 3-hydroxylase family protein [Photorhabdus]|uniref:4-hydroxyphenylacetate 3-monooxygenase n=2 Tax=Photorhabdus asymbiotica TaxID=291112 RepID=A0ABX9SKT5_9GAMM|nr:4-hydroxyphenylacetate 3-hydroxylase N-terminal domain-containing protein [Photorhabdus asymbiotica]RKS58094.1 4-hydroxyphenylacetate 3-monooxygenase [Photorhabdus asymbiotica]CAQ82571.1 similar to 4-hydroxyphenylacetate 3-monooxygenase [Photorhabdus asymbiotica]